MVEFNPDGSIRLPAKLAMQKAAQNSKMHGTRCMTIRKEIVSTYPPKSCVLHITLSDMISDSRFVSNIYSDFSNNAKVPSRLIEIGEKEFRIEIGTCFTRCSDCTALIGRYREFLDSNVIEQQGLCTFKSRVSQKFCYEDSFE
jgi:hypothetical protein